MRNMPDTPGIYSAKSSSPSRGRDLLKVSAPMLEHAVRVAGGVPPDDLDRNGFGTFLDASGELEVKYLLGRIEQPPTGDVGTRNGPPAGAGYGAVRAKREVIGGPSTQKAKRDSPIPNGDKVRTR